MSVVCWAWSSSPRQAALAALPLAVALFIILAIVVAVIFLPRT
jgi:hypothetical protein